MKTKLLETGPTISSDTHVFQNKAPAPGSQWVDRETATIVKSYEYKRTIGATLPGYRDRLKRGELLPQLPFTQVDYLFTRGGSQGSYKDSNGYDSRWVGAMPISWSFDPLEIPDNSEVIPEDLGYFVQKAAANIVGSGHDTLTMLAELASTKRMFVNFGRRLISVFSNRPKRVTAEDMISAWLEGRYGWRPLYHDLRNLVEAINAMDDRRTRYSERAGTTTKISSQHTTPRSSTGCTFDLIRSDEWEISCRGSVVADIEVSGFRTSPIATAYEVIPLSFVIDWFVNIGQWLDAASFRTFVKAYAASSGYKITLTRTEEIQNVVTLPGYSQMVREGSCAVTCIWKARSPTTVPLNIRLLPNVDEFKLLDIVALVLQRLR